METEKNYNAIVDGVIWRQLLTFFFPVLLGTLFQQLYNTVDAVIVGRFVGKAALAAVGGSSSQILNLLIGFFSGVASGAAVIVAQYYGAGDREDSSRAVHTAILISTISGALMTVIGIISAPGLLRLMDTPADTMADSLSYLRIVYLAMVPSMIYNMGSAILRAIGDSKRPLYFLIACCLVNVVLDLFFVVTLQMGAAGAAVATALAQLFSALLVLAFLCRAEDSVRLSMGNMRMNLKMMKRTVKIGLPTGLQAVMYSISNMIIMAAINSFGTDTAAAWVAMGKLDAIMWLILNAFGISIMTFVGQNFGAHRGDRVKESIWVCLLMSLGACAVISSVLLIFGKYMMIIFTDDKKLIELALSIMIYIVPWYFLYAPVEILGGGMRGMGEALVPFIITALGVCVSRVIWIYSVVPRFRAISTVALSYPVTWALALAAFGVYYFYLKKHRAELRKGK